MKHFFDMLHVKVLSGEDAVVLSVAVSNSRVDEYRIELAAFQEMLDAFQDSPAEWAGSDKARVRVDTEHKLVGLSLWVTPDKREVYRVELPLFKRMAARFRSQVVR